MPLASGVRLGAYEIVDALGAGGMGEVYRARDTRLKREVAIKVLPEAVAQDADRLARFRREAELLAGLNHPNIAAVYGLEESGGITAIVLELVEGETLEQRIEASASGMEKPSTEVSRNACRGRGVMDSSWRSAGVPDPAGNSGLRLMSTEFHRPRNVR